MKIFFRALPQGLLDASMLFLFAALLLLVGAPAWAVFPGLLGAFVLACLIAGIIGIFLSIAVTPFLSRKS
jgi:hypothetical protein